MGKEVNRNWQGKAAFVAFAKNPELVPVKTRLAETLGQERARRLYIALLQDCLTSLGSAKSADHYLACYPDASGDLMARLGAEHGFKLIQQEGKDLGERMLNCVKKLLDYYSAVIVFGTDVPVLPLQTISDSLGRLEYWDVVLGPSRDGGYWAFGAKRVNDLMFEGIEWGSSSVFVETIKNCVKFGLEVAFLDVCEDIDDQKSLANFCELLAKGSDGATASRSVLKELGLLVGRD